MLSEPLVGVALVFALFALGEYLSIISRARIPMLFVVLFGYLILLWTGVFPKNIMEKAHIAAFAAILPAPLIVHMGTLIPIKKIKAQYKAVLIALSGLIAAAILVIVICVPILGYKSAVSGIGPLSGGVIAFVITSQKLHELGLVSLVTIPALVLGLQNFVGMPIASHFLRKYGLKLRKQLNDGTLNQVEQSGAGDQAQAKRKAWLPEKYQTHFILLFQVFLGAAIAVGLDALTGINYSLWALAIGVVGSYFGFYQENMMERANSFGLMMALLIAFVMTSMNDITPGMFTTYLPHVILIMVVGVVGMLIGGYISARLLKWDQNKGIPVALTALFGFPADFILCQEVSRSVGNNKQERDMVFNEIMAPMLIGGFTTVTIASIIIAGILVGTF